MKKSIALTAAGLFAFAALMGGCTANQKASGGACCSEAACTDKAADGSMSVMTEKKACTDKAACTSDKATRTDKAAAGNMSVMSEKKACSEKALAPLARPAKPSPPSNLNDHVHPNTRE